MRYVSEIGTLDGIIGAGSDIEGVTVGGADIGSDIEAAR